MINIDRRGHFSLNETAHVSNAKLLGSTSHVIPELHGIATTNICLDRMVPEPHEYTYRPRNGPPEYSGIWYTHRLFRNAAFGSAGREPCHFLKRTKYDMRKMTSDQLTSSPLYFSCRRCIHSPRGSTLQLGSRVTHDVNRDNSFTDSYLGSFEPSPTPWTDRIPATPPFKYCRHIATGVPKSAIRRIPGVAIMLVELHANVNIGHAAKDLVFLAHVLNMQREARGTNNEFSVSAILVDDVATSTGNLTAHQSWRHRHATLAAMVAGYNPRIHIIPLQQGSTVAPAFGHESFWGGARTVCFNTAVQKGMAYPGDYRSASLLRRRMYSVCDIDFRATADTVLIVLHGNSSDKKDTCRWHDLGWFVRRVSTAPFISSWCAHNTCRALRVQVRSMHGLTVCEQVALFARSKVVFVHHGAAMANALYMRGTSVVVEMNKQWNRRTGPMSFSETFVNAGYGAMLASTGTPYIGARVTYGVWSAGHRSSGIHVNGSVRWSDQTPPYDHEDPYMEVGINQTRFVDVLNEVGHILHRQTGTSGVPAQGGNCR